MEVCLPQALREAADPVKWAWVHEVYARLGFPWPLESPLAREQTGSFASLYDELEALPLPWKARAEILAHDLEWARKNGRNRRNRKRGAVFCHVHNGRVATYLARDGPRR